MKNIFKLISVSLVSLLVTFSFANASSGVFKLSHDDKTLHYIKKRMDFWNKYNLYEQGIGKIYQKTNMEMMSRKVYI